MTDQISQKPNNRISSLSVLEGEASILSGVVNLARRGTDSERTFSFLFGCRTDGYKCDCNPQCSCDDYSCGCVGDCRTDCAKYCPCVNDHSCDCESDRPGCGCWAD